VWNFVISLWKGIDTTAACPSTICQQSFKTDSLDYNGLQCQHLDTAVLVRWSYSRTWYDMTQWGWSWPHLLLLLLMLLLLVLPLPPPPLPPTTCSNHHHNCSSCYCTQCRSEVVLSSAECVCLKPLLFLPCNLCKRGLYRHAVSVCLSVRSSHSWILLKRINIPSATPF